MTSDTRPGHRQLGGEGDPQLRPCRAGRPRRAGPARQLDLAVPHPGAETGSGTYTFDGGNYPWVMSIAEYKDMPTSGVLDKTATDSSGANTAATADTGTTATTTQATELVIAVMAQNAANSGVGSSFTTADATGDGGSIVGQDIGTKSGGGSASVVVMEDDITGPNFGTDTYYASTTFDGSVAKWAGAIATFKANI